MLSEPPIDSANEPLGTPLSQLLILAKFREAGIDEDGASAVATDDRKHQLFEHEFPVLPCVEPVGHELPGALEPDVGLALGSVA